MEQATLLEYNEVLELQKIEQLDTPTLLEQINKLSEFINSLKPAETVEEIKDQSRQLKQALDEVEAKRKQHFQNLTDQQKQVIGFENAIKEKRKEYNARIEELEAEIKDKREAACEEYFNEVVQRYNGEIFNFITFKDHVYTSSMRNSDIFTKTGIKKPIREHIENTVQKYNNDFLLISKDDYADLILGIYKGNGYNYAEAKIEADKQVEAIARAEEEKRIKAEAEAAAAEQREAQQKAAAEAEARAKEADLQAMKQAGFDKVDEPAVEVYEQQEQPTPAPKATAPKTTPEPEAQAFEYVVVKIETERVDGMKQFIQTNGKMAPERITTVSEIIDKQTDLLTFLAMNDSTNVNNIKEINEKEQIIEVLEKLQKGEL